MNTAGIVTEAVALGADSIALESRRGSKPSLVAVALMAAYASPSCAQQTIHASHNSFLHREDPNAIAAIAGAVGYGAPPTMLEMQK
jgi:hypothetical protein